MAQIPHDIVAQSHHLLPADGRSLLHIAITHR
jgi:hypothetical protein